MPCFSFLTVTLNFKLFLHLFDLVSLLFHSRISQSLVLVDPFFLRFLQLLQFFFLLGQFCLKLFLMFSLLMSSLVLLLFDNLLSLIFFLLFAKHQIFLFGISDLVLKTALGFAALRRHFFVRVLTEITFHFV